MEAILRLLFGQRAEPPLGSGEPFRHCGEAPPSLTSCCRARERLAAAQWQFGAACCGLGAAEFPQASKLDQAAWEPSAASSGFATEARQLVRMGWMFLCLAHKWWPPLKKFAAVETARTPPQPRRLSSAMLCRRTLRAQSCWKPRSPAPSRGAGAAPARGPSRTPTPGPSQILRMFLLQALQNLRAYRVRSEPIA